MKLPFFVCLLVQGLIISKAVSAPGAPDKKEGIDCLKEINSFCDRLYDPGNPLGYGNADLGSKQDPIKIRFGKDQNDFFYSVLGFSKAKLAALDRLPAEFRHFLRKNGYQRAAIKYLNTPKPKSPEENQRVRDLYDKAVSAWNLAWDAALDQKKEKLHPGFLNKKPVPSEWGMDFKLLEEKMTHETYRAIWGEHPRFKKALMEFERVKKAYLEEIAESADIPAELKAKWTGRIQTVELKVPGTQDFLMDGECKSVERNSSYYGRHNAIVLCGGDLTTDEFTSTIAHELSHSIGEQRNVFLADTRSGISKEFLSLVKNMCEKQPSGCSPAWTRIKEDLIGKNAKRSLLQPLESYQSEAGNLRKCLQYTPRDPDPSELKKLASENARYRTNSIIGSLAGKSSFLLAIKPEVPAPESNVFVKNLSYLSPCEGYPFVPENNYLENAVRTFYIAEFQCRSESTDLEKMAEAIKVAKEVQRVILEAMIPMGGAFSNDPALLNHGLSEDSEERFADWMGARVYARILRSEPEERRLDLLKASMAFLCEQPNGLAKIFPEEANLQKKLDPEPHSLKGLRRKEVLTRPIREAVGCKMDDLEKECGF